MWKASIAVSRCQFVSPSSQQVYKYYVIQIRIIRYLAAGCGWHTYIEIVLPLRVTAHIISMSHEYLWYDIHHHTYDILIHTVDGLLTPNTKHILRMKVN